MYQNMVQPGTAAGQQTMVPTGLQLGLGTRAASNEIIFTQGDFSQTDNPLDMVIQGNGFFQMRRPTGELAYTRAGQFQLDKDGNMVDRQRRSARAADHHSRRRAADHHRHRRHRQLHAARPDRGAAGRPDPAGQLPESRRPEQHRQQSLSAHRRLGRRRPSALPAGRKVSARCCRATPSNRTSAWWTNSST